MRRLVLTLVGERSESIPAHLGIDACVRLAQAELELDVRWVRTDDDALGARLERSTGVWLVPGSPYASMAGALRAVRWARERDVAFLGTCGGFQHAVLEFARHVGGAPGADHAESSPDAEEQVMVPLDCALLDATEHVRVTAGSRLALACGATEVSGEYQCRYGLAESWRARLEAAGLVFSGFDAAGRVRACELPAHRFFVGTLFQPERRGLRGELAPLVRSFFEAAAS
jgi:CTP synthase (UTP-ammonia lyase)